MESIRIDKWLWAARFFKTRSVAQDAIGLGRVLLDGQRLKASREVKVGDKLEIHRAGETFVVIVEALSPQRGPASEAQKLYTETQDSMKIRAEQKALLRLASEPAQAIRKGRPTKREGRELRRFQEDWS